MYFNIQPPSEQIAEIMGRIYRAGLTTATGGNISVRVGNGDIWTTPGGVDKGALTPPDVVCLSADGSIRSKHGHRPTSELPAHQAIYQKREDLHAIIHAHSPALVAFSMARKAPETMIIPQAHGICGKVGYAPYRISGSEALGESISGEFAKGYNSVIMENHAAIIGGHTLLEAFRRLETLELCACTIIRAKAIGNNYTKLSEVQVQTCQHRINVLPELKKVIHTADERQIRSDICRVVKRACSWQLMISTCGTVSVRWRGNDFLITPADVDRAGISQEDIVQIRDGQREPGKNPSRLAWLHQDIYESHPHIHCIVTAQSPNVMAYGVSGSSLNTRASPESYVLLRDIPILPFGSQANGGKAILEVLSEQVPVVLMQHEAVLVTGRSLSEAFGRLEVTEATAQSLIHTLPLGGASPIEEQHIEQLKREFLA